MPRRRHALMAVAAAVVLSVVMTWPLAPHLDSVGRTANSGDARFGVWNVAWVAHALTTDPRGVYDANIFYPHRRTLAFSEANLGAGALAVPVWWLTRSPFAAYNSVVLFAFVSSFLAMWCLARHLTGDPLAAGVSAILFAFCPYLFSHTAHIQLLMAGGIPLALLLFHRLVAAPSIARGLLLGLALAGQALSCAYYGVFAALTVTFGALVYAGWARRWASAAYWTALGTGAVVSMAVVLPFFVPYMDIQDATGFARTLEDARMYSATIPSYLASSAHAHQWMLPLIGDWNGIVLFPGFVALALAGSVALPALRRRRAGGDPEVSPAVRWHALFYASLGLLAFWASLGPRAGLYTWLHESLPIFSFLRAPSRMGILVVLALAVGSGYGARALAALGGAGWRRTAVALGIAGLALAELAVAPLDWRPVRTIPQAYAVLADMPRGALVVFPFYAERSELHLHTRYMLNSTAHWQPLVNGYSDFIPDDFRAIAPRLATFPSAESFEAMKERRVRYIAVQTSRYVPEHLAAVRRALDGHAGHFQLLASDDRVLVFEVLSWPQ